MKTDWMLGLGALVGLALAVAGLVRRPEVESLPPDAAALVNGHSIPRVELSRALASLRAELPNADARALEQHALDRLIEEQLLIEAALEMRLTERDPRVRADLGAAAIGSLTEGDAREPTEAELREFYSANPGVFRLSPRYRIRLTRVQAIPVPDALLPIEKLRDYLGASEAAAIERLEPGQAAAGLRLLEKTQGVLPEFEEIREQVRGEFVRRASEERLVRFLGERRQQARILLAADLR